MKKIVFILMAVLALVSCDNHVGSVSDFKVTVSRIESHKVWLDVIPTDEFLPYYLDYVSEDEWKKYGANPEQKYMDDLKSLSTEVLRERIYQGAFFDALWVKPSTNYVVLLTQMSGYTPVQVRTISFTTQEEKMETLVIDSIKLTPDGMLTVYPKDKDRTYFWNYALKSEIDQQWYGSHSIWFYYDIDFYYQMDFMRRNPEDGILSRGNDSENIFAYYQTVDTLCVMVVGYEGLDENYLGAGETSVYMPYKIAYNKDAATTAVAAATDYLEDWYHTLVTSPKRRTAKASLSIQGCSPKSLFDRKGRYIPQHIRSRQR